MVIDYQTVSDGAHTLDAGSPKGGAPPGVSKRGIRAMQGEPDLADETSSEVLDAQDESFEITDWSGYPDGPRPEGPFWVLEGDEYERARDSAHQTNRALHRNNPARHGLEVHEVHPVKLGGSPTDLDNKIFLTPQEHARYTTWWNNVIKNRATR